MPLFLQRVPEEESLTGTTERDRFEGIRCPKCRWRPKPESRWQCGCGCSWNTFATRGKCPDCSFQWHDTACLQCHRWSPHDDWYELRGSSL